jgi:hypothetical protein
VNPKGQGAKKIDVSLNCVDTVSNHPSGFPYLARFSWTNQNNTAVYVPLGPDNFFTALGSYVGTPPVLFPPGSGIIEIPFDGQKLIWTVKSMNGNQKTSAATEASSTSNKCAAHLTRGIEVPVSGTESLVLYPNPTFGAVRIQSVEELPANTTVRVYDLLGKQHPVSFGFEDGNTGISLDMSALKEGIYLVKLSSASGEQIFRVVKY